MKKKGTNIVIISFAFPPFNFSGTERPYQFAKYLPAYNYKPLVISQKNFINYHCIENDYNLLDKLTSNTRLYRLRTFKSIFLENQLVYWFDNLIFKITGKKKILTRIVQSPGQLIYGKREWEFQVFWLCIYLKFVKKIKLIWATGPDWRNLEVGYSVSRLLHIPLVVDMRDPWTYGVLWNPESDKVAESQILTEKNILKHASKVIFTSPKTEEIMVNKYPEFLKNKTGTITNGFDTEIVDRPKSKNKDRFIISYTGRLSKGIRDPKVLLEGFRLACNNPEFSKDVLLRFVGYMDDFKNDILDYNTYNNIIITDPVTREESIEIMYESDVLLLIQTIPGVGNDVISGKLFEYINTCRPILAIVPPDGGDAWLLNQIKTGYCHNLDDIDSIHATLLNLWDQWKKGNSKAINNTDLSRFSRYALTKELAEVFNTILN